MRNIIIFLFFFYLLTSPQKTQSQSFIGTEVSESWLFFDKFDNSGSAIDLFSGYGLQTSLDILYSIELSNSIRTDFGLGYSHFWVLDSRYIYNLSYINIRMGAKIKTFWHPMRLSIAASNYVLIGQERDDYLNLQKPVFTNLDIGLQFKLGKRFELKVSSPITIFPMYKGEWEEVASSSGYFQVFNAWVETTGLNIGLLYKLKS